MRSAICTKCNQEKPVEDFTPRKSPKGHHSWCKECINSIRKFYSLRATGAVIKNDYNYEEALAAQDGVCYLCKELPTYRDLDIDHSHETGKLRKLLCVKCNWLVGRIENNMELVEDILQYLEMYK